MDGLPTKALLDTSSPVSIISLDFFRRAAAAKQTDQQSPAEWEREVYKHLQPASMSLRSHGGAELPVLAQVLSVGEKGVLSVNTRCRYGRGHLLTFY